MKKHIKVYFWTFFLVLSVFTKEIGMIEIGTIQFDFISYPFFIVAFLYFLFIKKIPTSISEFIFFFLILTIGIIDSIWFDLPLNLLFKQYVPIVIIYYGCKSIIFTYDVKDVFRLYVYFVFIASLIGIVQFLLKFFFGILFLTPYHHMFLDSVALEPSHYVAIALPAFIYLLEKKVYDKIFIIILLSLLLTFKITFLFSLTIYFLIKYVKRLKTLFFVAPIVFFAFVMIVKSNKDFNDRVDGVLSFFQEEDLTNVENGTSFSFVSNFKVANNNFLKSYGLGVGLGGHATTYERFFGNSKYSYVRLAGLNANSGHSLIIRVFSEMGFIGLLLYFYLFKSVLSLKTFELRVIGFSSLSYFIVRMLKLGGYFDYGLMFFLVIIILVVKMDKLNKLSTNNNIL